MSFEENGVGRTYLITGGAGNLACQLTFYLAARGHRVVLFDLAQAPAAPVADGCVYRRGDVTSEEAVRAALREHGPASILHFSSLLSGRSELERRRAWSVNLDGAFALFEQALDQGVEQVFFPSSLAAYGGKLPSPLPEDFPQWPSGLYGVTKAAVERLGVYYHERHGLDFRCIRLPVVISALAHPGAASAYASRAFVEAAHFNRFTFRVRPETRPSIIYVKDVIRAIAGMLETPGDRLTRRVYNIHAMAPSAQRISDVIRRRLPEARIGFDPLREVVDLIESWPTEIDDASARSDWDWKPRYDLEALADDFVQELRRDPAYASSV